jgi:hypothetical protein
LVRCRTVLNLSLHGRRKVWWSCKGDDEICPTKRSYQSLWRESHTGISEAHLPRVCCSTFSEGCFKECLRRVFARDAHKSVSEGCLQRVSSQECPSLMWFEEVAFPINSPGQSSALLLHRCAKKDLGNFKKHPQRRRV